nr:calcium-binding protein [uncultured Shinella sp.]
MAEFSVFGAADVDMRNISVDLISDADLAESGPGYNEYEWLRFQDLSSYPEILYELRGWFSYSVDEITLDVDWTPSSTVSFIRASWVEYDDDIDLIEGLYEIRGFELNYTYFDGSMTSNSVAEVIFKYSDRIDGSWGNDYLMGYGGRDTLFGDSGNDTLDGGSGSDVMLGDSGNDVYIVDSSLDVVWEYKNDGFDTVKSSVNYELSNDVERLILTGIEDADATGNALANSLVGNAANNILDGKSGADMMSGGKGNDIYIVDNVGDKVIEAASSGTDFVYASVTYSVTDIHVEGLTLTGSSHINATGNGLANTLTGNSGNNTLDAGTGNDKLIGGGGNDRLIGGAGGDRLTGGDGADRFIFKSIADSTVASSGRDAIFDFDRLEGDKIDLLSVDANTKLSGNQAFKFLGSAAYTKTAGELRTVVKNGDTFVYGDVNGDGATDFSILVDTSARIYSTDFFL